MIGKIRETFIEKFIRYFTAGALCIVLSMSVYGILFGEVSWFYKIVFFICTALVPFLIFAHIFINDAIYENGLKIVAGDNIARFRRFDKIKCIEVGVIGEEPGIYKIFIIHYDEKGTEPILLTELEYKNRDFLTKVIEECRKRCTRAIWIPMSLERRKEIMEKFGPVIKEKILSEKLGDWPCEMYTY